MAREWHKDGSYTDRSAEKSVTRNSDGSVREQTTREVSLLPFISDKAVTRDGDGKILHSEEKKS